MIDKIFIAIDVETTGLEAGTDEIIEVAAVKFRPGEVLETFAQLVKPRHSLPLKVTQLTHITTEMVADAPAFSAVAPELVRFLKSYPLVGHSVGFDLAMLQAQGMRLPQRAYDTFELATLLMPKSSAYRLSALTAQLGIEHPDAHRALADAHAARALFCHLLGRMDVLPLDEINEIVRLTGKLAEWGPRDLFEEIQREKVKTSFIAPPPAFAAAAATEPPLPLKPSGDERPIALDDVRGFFAADGALGKAFPGYEQRQQQVEMAVGVAAALNAGDALMVEAGTGTGKGMAYLVPAAMFAARRGQRVVVSTNTINLQDQLFFKDIPMLQQIMAEHTSIRAAGAEPGAPPFTPALLKGRGNYLCLKRYKDLRRDGRLVSDEIKAVLKAQLWLPGTTSGDRAELMLLERETPAWSKMSAAFEQCTGPRCEEYERCFFYKARKQAEAAHIVVVNHALLLADLIMETDVIPPYDHVIIDEAHNLEDVATDQFSFEVDQERLLEFLAGLYQEGGVRLVDGLLAELPTAINASKVKGEVKQRIETTIEQTRPAVFRARDAVYGCFNYLTAFLGSTAEVTSYDARLRVTKATRRDPAWADVERAWEQLSTQLGALSEGIGRLEAMLLELKDLQVPDYEAVLMQVQAAKRYATEVRVNIGHIIVGGEEELITWLTRERNRDTLLLSAAPLTVAELLQANLFANKATTVLTSATLSVGGDFNYVKSRIGLDEPEELQLDSPFNYEQNALVYIPNDMPEPNHANYQRQLEQTIVELATATDGRMLVLFTANNALRTTHRAIQEPLEDIGITVLGQGIDGSRRSVLDRFREYPRSVLLGTTSFWEGVDVVGDALSVLVIAKLPFAVPNDPVVAARSEGFADSFSEYQVPQAILRFKQGFGRLIRSKEDRGVVVCLDRRLLSKRYGQTFLDSLPHTLVRSGPVKQLPSLAARFLASKQRTP